LFFYTFKNFICQGKFGEKYLFHFSFLYSRDGFIRFVGDDEEADAAYGTSADRVLDLEGRASVTPGLIDGHTHPVWAGDRVHEFAMKVRSRGENVMKSAASCVAPASLWPPPLFLSFHFERENALTMLPLLFALYIFHRPQLSSAHARSTWADERALETANATQRTLSPRRQQRRLQWLRLTRLTQRGLLLLLLLRRRRYHHHHGAATISVLCGCLYFLLLLSSSSSSSSLLLASAISRKMNAHFYPKALIPALVRSLASLPLFLSSFLLSLSTSLSYTHAFGERNHSRFFAALKARPKREKQRQRRHFAPQMPPQSLFIYLSLCVFCS
jgi:hypothetical protein